MQYALAGSSISKEAEHHIISILVFFCKCQSCSGTDLCTYNSVTTKEVNILSKEVHTSSLSFGTTCGFTIEFCHTAIYRYTFCNCQSVIPVSCNKRILRFGSCHTSCSYCLLPYVGMKEATDLTLHFIFFFGHQ